MFRNQLKQELLSIALEVVDWKTDGLNSHNLELKIDEHISKVLNIYFPLQCLNCKTFTTKCTELLSSKYNQNNPDDLCEYFYFKE